MTFRIFTAIILMMALLVHSPADAAADKIVLTAADGQRIVGSFSKGDSGIGVVLLHMYRNSKESWQPLLEKLQGRGITTLAIDMRGHGESRLGPEGEDLYKKVVARDPELFNKMHLDAEAAILYLTAHGTDPDKVGLIGASVGCSVAIHTVSAGTAPVGTVVVMTPGKDYLGVSTMKDIENWPGIPLLILSSREELERGASTIYARLKNSGATLKVFEEDDIHGTNMLGKVNGAEELIADWLEESLHKSGEQTAPHLPLYRLKLRVHLMKSGRSGEDFIPIFNEINEIWQSQAGICFEIEAVYDDTPLANGINMTFAPDIGFFNGYYDGEEIQMRDTPILSNAPNPANSPTARTAAHELGHVLGLHHRQESDDNLMRSKTYGWMLNGEEVSIARKTAAGMNLEDTSRPDCEPPQIIRE